MNLAAAIESHPAGSPALVHGERLISYGELRSLVAATRGELSSSGLKEGDRAAIVCPNAPDFAVAYLAVLALGAVAVPLNPASPTAELSRQLDVVEARLVVADAAGRGVIEGSDERPIVAAESAATVPVRAVPPDAVERSPDDPAALLFTAGTAGSPRPACLSHGNLLANLEQAQSHPATALRPDDVVLGVVPLFHIYGLNIVLGMTLRSGASVVLEERFDAARALDLIGGKGVTVVPAAPPVFEALGRLDSVSGKELQGVRQAVSGAAPLDQAVAERFSSRYGLPLWQGYGLTEASPAVASSLLLGEPRPGSVGLPLPGVEVRLVDDDGADALVGDPGELVVRGPNVFGGYWRDAEATAAVLSADGWLRTGDIAVADDDGCLYLVDRAKDLIIVSGFNVYPAEVEEVILSRPGVSETAVLGEPDPVTGEAVRAYVVTDPGAQLTAEDIVSHCAASLARYKCPSAVSFVASLPRGLGGKLLRRELR